MEMRLIKNYKRTENGWKKDRKRSNVHKEYLKK